MIKDTYLKTGETFYRNKTAKEVGKDVKSFLKFSWRKANFVYINLFIFLIYYISAFKSFNWNLCTNILFSSVTIGITAIGMALIIIGGDIDLSAGSIFAFVAGISALVYNQVYAATGKRAILALFITLLFALVFGFLLGAVNGFFVGYLHRPSFIVTLATRLIYRSLIVYTLSAQPGHISTFRLSGYGSKGDPLYAMGNKTVATLPIVGILFILLILAFFFRSNRTKYGRKIYAVGSNSKAASLIGIRVNFIKASVFALEGALIGFAAFLQLGIRGNIDPSAAGKSYELYAIASNVLGGISMAGGSGNILGVLFGALAFQTIDKIIAALKLSPNLNDTIKGLILLVAVVFQIIRFSPEGAHRFFVKCGILFNTEKDNELEGERQKKYDQIEKSYRKKVRAVCSAPEVSDEEKKAKAFALLEQRDKEKNVVAATYQQKIEQARERIAEHNKGREEKKKAAEALKIKKNEELYLANKDNPKPKEYKLPSFFQKKKASPSSLKKKKNEERAIQIRKEYRAERK